MSIVRWSVRAALLLALAAPQAPAAAGSASTPPPAPAADAATAGEAGPDPFCASFGKGFTRLAGSSTCVRISGHVQMDGYNQSVSGGAPGALQPALRSQ